MSTEIVPIKTDDFDLFLAPAPTRPSTDEAGLGAEDIGSQHIIMPRMGLLQAMSKTVAAKMPGAKPGAYYLSPFNRPVTDPESQVLVPTGGLMPTMLIVVVRIYPTQRRWKSLDEGGGIICEAPTGNLEANEPKGLAGGRLSLMMKKDKVTDVDWEGGTPTSKCWECVYGPAAAAGAKGVPPTKTANPWLPKKVDYNGKVYDLDDKFRSPKCTQGIDALVLVLVPQVGGGTPEVVPAFMTFNRTSYAAGKQLSSMVKMNTREPAWSRVYEVGSSSVTNDKGSFFVTTVASKGFSTDAIASRARDLYYASKEVVHVPDMSGEDHGASTGASTGASAPTKDLSDEAAPEDSF